MLRTFITITNNATQPGGPNAGNLDQNFTEVNGIIYDNYLFADPNVAQLSASPTISHPEPMVRAQEYLDLNFYRIFYPMPGDEAAVLNNPWLAISASQCSE